MIKKTALSLIRVYKLAVSPYLPSTCIYQPTCSEYAAEAIEMHGVTKGSWMGIKRLARCNPFVTGGFDTVPHVDESALPSTSSAETRSR